VVVISAAIRSAACHAGASKADGPATGSGLRSVQYRDGSICRIGSARRIGGARRCPLKGFVEPQLPPVSRAALASPINVRVGHRPEHPGPKT
jgi:hypothetical protein